MNCFDSPFLGMSRNHASQDDYEEKWSEKYLQQAASLQDSREEEEDKEKDTPMNPMMAMMMNPMMQMMMNPMMMGGMNPMMMGARPMMGCACGGCPGAGGGGETGGGSTGAAEGAPSSSGSPGGVCWALLVLVGFPCSIASNSVFLAQACEIKACLGLIDHAEYAHLEVAKDAQEAACQGAAACLAAWEDACQARTKCEHATKL